MNAADVVREVDEAGLRLVRFLYCGNDGTIRGKARAATGSRAGSQSGIGLTVAMQAMNSLDHLQPVPDMGPVGEVRLRPDPDTFRVLPYAPRTGAMLVDMIGLDGNPAPVCQRSFLEAHVRPARPSAACASRSRSRTSSRSRAPSTAATSPSTRACASRRSA